MQEYAGRRHSAPKKSAREYALSLLEYADRTEQQLRQKLCRQEYSAGEIEEAVLFLKEYHYLDDGAYAGRYVRSASAKKSTRQIRAALEQKGVARELIEAALQEQPVDEEGQICALLRKKGYDPEKKMAPEEYRRILSFLARRGFSYDSIRKVMEDMREENFGDFGEI